MSRPRVPDGLGLVLFRLGASALLLVAAGGVVVVLAGLAMPFAERESLGGLIEMGLGHATALISCAVGFALVWRAAHRPAARALAWFLGFFALFWSSVHLTGMFDDDVPGTPPLLVKLEETAGLIIYLTIWLAPAAFLRFSMLFPRALTPEDLASVRPTAVGGDSHAGAEREVESAPVPPHAVDDGAAEGSVRTRRSFHLGRFAPVEVAARLRPAAARVARLGFRALNGLRRVLLDPRPVWGIALVAGSVPLVLVILASLTGFEGSSGDGPLLVQLVAAAFALFVVFFVLVAIPAVIAISVLNLRLSYRLADVEDRRRIRWIVDGCVVGVIALFANPALQAIMQLIGLDSALTQTVTSTVFGVGVLAMVICLAVGVFYDGALESALVVRRSAIYSAFGVLLTFVFAGVEGLVSNHLVIRFGLPNGASSFLAGGAAALAFGALRGLVGRVAGGRAALARPAANSSAAAPRSAGRP